MSEKNEEVYALTESGIEMARLIYALYVNEGFELDEIAEVVDLTTDEVRLLFAMANYAGVFDE